MKHTVQIKGLLLLLIYIIGQNPFVFFHHHHPSIPSYEQATACEKNIFYTSQDASCKHGKHFSKIAEKCKLCDHHVCSPCTVPFHFYQHHPIAYSSNSFQAVAVEFYPEPCFLFSGRGPPVCSPYIG